MENIAQLNKGTYDCVSFARRTFTNPKIRTFATPKCGHLPPPKTVYLPGGQLPPPIFFFFFLAHFSWLFRLRVEDIKGGKEEVLDEVVNDHWSWSTSSKGA